MAVFTLWDPGVAFPPFREIPLLDVVTHVVVERASANGWHYLHETSLAMYRGRLYCGWASSREEEVNEADEVYRGRSSDDGGLNWGPDFVIAPGAVNGAHNHGAMISHDGRLWCFVCRHDERKLTGMEVFTLDDASGAWQSAGIGTPGFIPFHHPQRMADGNWIMAGETAFRGDMAVAISDGDDFTRWQVVPIKLGFERNLRFPETTVFPTKSGDWIAVARCETIGTAYHDRTPDECAKDNLALASRSSDCGRTWTPALQTNLPIWPSKPFAGVLSNGKPYLIHNVAHPDGSAHKRNTLAISVGEPGADVFSRIHRIRSGECPSHAFYSNPQWAYPCAMEHEGKLYVSYTINKSDAGLSIIPVGVL